MRKLFALVAAIVTMGALSACGSNSSGDSGSGKLPKSGTVGIVVSTLTSEAEARWAKTATTALKDVGWTAKVVDGGNDPAKYQQAITGFINQKVAGIITIAIDAPAIKSTLLSAKQADIPVIAAGIRVDPSGADDFSATYAPSDTKLGTIAADYLKTKVAAGSQYVVLDLSAVFGAHAPVVAANPILKAAGFKLVGTHDISVQDIVGSAQKGAVDLMTAHPDAKFMFGCCDFTAALTVPALSAAGHSNVIQTVRYDNLSTLALIRAGKPVATAATDADRGVLLGISQILRHKAKGTKVDRNADKGIYHYTMVDKSNVPAAGKFYYDPAPIISDYVAKWKSAYGL